MRKWIVEETGEVRSPEKGDWFISDTGDFMYMQSKFICSPRQILKFVEITGRQVMFIEEIKQVPSFDEWNW